MRSILVTGGAGFIGSNFVRFWLRKHPEDKITVLDALTYAGNIQSLADIINSFKFIHESITDYELLNKIFNNEQINTVVHFAAESHVDRSILGPKPFIDTNINGTLMLLEAARSFWAKKSYDECRFVHVSTDEVYGSLGPGDYAFTENHPYKPNSPYAASKASSDHLVRSYYKTYNLPVNITNCSNNYGPYQFPEKLIPLMVINALNHKPLPVYGEGKNIRDWLHVWDHCRALERVIMFSEPGESYNIGGDNEWFNIDLVQLICSELDKITGRLKNETAGLIRFVNDRPGHDFRYAIDSNKIRSKLGWEPEMGFDTGLQDTIRWYIENESWWQNIINGKYRDYYNQQYGSRLVDEQSGEE